MLSPAVVVFVGMSVFGTILVFTSSGLLGMWVGLELGLFGFLPILNGKTVGENESAVKYFVVQAVGSGLILMSFLLVSGEWMVVFHGSYVGEVVNWIMVTGFMTKLGVFPLHFWFPSVMGLASWFSCFWLSIVQKVGPFWGLSGLGLSSFVCNVVVFFLVVTSLVGAFGGLAQVQFRPLLAYSSLGQTGWMGLLSLMNVEVFLMYMFLYSLILVGLLCSLYLVKLYGLGGVSGWGSREGLLFWVFSGGFFISLSGLPPLAGSAMKLLGVLVIISKYPGVLVVLIFSSMVSLYYYLSVFINSVVCLGSSGYSGLVSMFSKGRVAFLVSAAVLLNWVGGLPFFLVCGVLMA